MHSDDAAVVPGLSGMTQVWKMLRTASRGVVVGDTVPLHNTQPLPTRPEPPSTQPTAFGITSLDGVRAVFWQAYRHLFPSHSVAGQTPQGNIVISWSVMDDPNASYPYAAPVMLRLDETLVAVMANSDANQRRRIAQTHEPALREGLRGYDPFARIPNARIVSLG
jgi:hypothetical protein